MHRDEKPFVCEYEDCNAAFRQRQHLVDHTFIHTGEKQFECSTCSKAFQTRKRLQDHLYKVHSSHRYNCDRCEKSFLKPHLLKNHLFSAHKVGIDDVSHLKIKLSPLDQLKRQKK
ncbi:zinc finger protein 69 homolog [Musca vetustissima]|uniref:zinc finger protein 69 homolog n=1 Tax=Musca vetustissima TaxID=27455 RepID=UPI002AB6BC96|nr:zinc finger protein 69 homolog [Musca vetustissima]